MRELLEEREALLRAQIAAAAGRLADIAEQIAKDGLTVEGSEKQPVAHKLLAVERDVQRGQRDAYAALQGVLREKANADLLERANSITAWKSRADSTPK